MLTIMIPTYNRNELLNRCVNHLLPQLNEFVKIIILDNKSDVPVEDTVKSVSDSDRIRIIRNNENIGGNANVVKAFELCDTEWMWLLCDDDIPTDDSIRIILEDIDSDKDVVFYNYATRLLERGNVKRGKVIETCGLENFIDSVDYFGNILFASTGVYQVKYLKPWISYGYMFSYSMMPHMVMLFLALNKTTLKANLSNNVVVNWSGDQDDTWSQLRMSLVRNTILELPLNLDNEYFKKLRVLISHRRKPMITVVNSFIEILKITESKDKVTDYYHHLFRQVYFRNNKSGVLGYMLYLLMDLILDHKVIVYIYVKLKMPFYRKLIKRNNVDVFSRH